MPKNYYPEMLDLLVSSPINKVPDEKIVHWFMQHRPHSIIQAIKAIEAENKPSKEPSFIATCRDLKARKSTVEAVRHYREITGAPLKEAIAIIKSL